MCKNPSSFSKIAKGGGKTSRKRMEIVIGVSVWSACDKQRDFTFYNYEYFVGTFMTFYH